MANLAYIQVTRECNQECRFCSNPPTRKKISRAKIRQLLDSYQKKKYEGVIFSGGEPTLYPRLAEVIRYAARNKFHCRIITNGQKLARRPYLLSLLDAGLKHICLSVYSCDSRIQGKLTRNPASFDNIKKALEHLAKERVTVDIVTVINKYNADHLDRTVAWLIKNYPFLSHFVWNNLDPLMNRASRNKDTIPRLIDFEVSLQRAMSFLDKQRRTFRVERVPLCYMAEFAHCATETRKIVKEEERMVYFLDEKKLTRQKRWVYQKAACCRSCFLTSICAGLYQMDTYYSSRELFPVFLDPGEVTKRIRNNG